MCQNTKRAVNKGVKEIEGVDRGNVGRSIGQIRSNSPISLTDFESKKEGRDRPSKKYFRFCKYTLNSQNTD
jgi:hypothetical protein